MLTTTSELKAATSAGLVVRIDKVSVALATSDLDQSLFASHTLERILFKFYKLATSTVNTHLGFKIDRLFSAFGYVCNNLLPIQQVNMIGLKVTIPFSDFLDSDHNSSLA